MKLSIKRTFCALLLGLASTGAAARCASMCGGVLLFQLVQVILCHLNGRGLFDRRYERPFQPF